MIYQKLLKSITSSSFLILLEPWESHLYDNNHTIFVALLHDTALQHMIFPTFYADFDNDSSSWRYYLFLLKSMQAYLKSTFIWDYATQCLQKHTNPIGHT